jgi:hypothetical protein
MLELCPAQTNSQGAHLAAVGSPGLSGRSALMPDERSMQAQHSSLRHLLGASSALLNGGRQPAEALRQITELWSESLRGAGVAIHLAISPDPGALRIGAETAMPEVSRFIFARTIPARASAYAQMAVEIEAPVAAPRELLNALDTLSLQLADFVERTRIQELLSQTHAQSFHATQGVL